MIYSFTGHRPNKLERFGKPYSEDQLKNVFNYIKSRIKNLPDFNTAYVGGAIGVDVGAALACYSLKIPYILAVPFRGQESTWKDKKTLERYQKTVDYAFEVVYVDELSPMIVHGFTPYKMQKRNEFMVDNSDCLIALWDGSKGGTGNCVNYATKVNKPIINLW